MNIKSYITILFLLCKNDMTFFLILLELRRFILRWQEKLESEKGISRNLMLKMGQKTWSGNVQFYFYKTVILYHWQVKCEIWNGTVERGADLCGALSGEQSFVGRSSHWQSSFHQAAGDARVPEETQQRPRPQHHCHVIEVATSPTAHFYRNCN